MMQDIANTPPQFKIAAKKQYGLVIYFTIFAGFITITFLTSPGRRSTIVLLLLGVWILSRRDKGTLPMSLKFFASAFQNTLSNKICLTVNANGIIYLDNEMNTSSGLIPWSAITDIKLVDYQNEQLITIQRNDLTVPHSVIVIKPFLLNCSAGKLLRQLKDALIYYKMKSM